MGKIEERVKQLRARRAEVVAEIRILETELIGLDAQLRRFESADAGSGSRPTNRTDQVWSILEASDRAMRPKDVALALRQLEPNIQENTVRGTLASLKKQGRADTVARGQWVAR